VPPLERTDILIHVIFTSGERNEFKKENIKNELVNLLELSTSKRLVSLRKPKKMCDRNE
jgi:hypothetical protein